MYSIQNAFIKIGVASQGAELQSISHVVTGQEYMWSGDAAFWGKYSPVLFPIVGALKENTYYVQGKSYQLPRHGFARDMEFRLYEQAADRLGFLLESNKDTLAKYPFGFQFYIDYAIAGNTLSVSYRVVNTGQDDMYFSVGGHPAFRVPLLEGELYEDYYLQFSQQEDTGKWPVRADGLLEAEPVPFLENTDRIPLTKALFYKDALVLKRLNSNSVQLLSGKSGKGFEFDFTGFPYLGIWAAKNADFVCIEPWCGIADSVTADQQLADKEGINRIAPKEEFKRTWSFTTIDGA
ncbi:MAG TPA: aldose 1-epimerase family protein [Niabella sp.]|nr:aldose 1-epimerase family protein [Niabella sp.]